MKALAASLVVWSFLLLGTSAQETTRIQAVGTLEILTPGFFTNVLKTNSSGLLRTPSPTDALVLGSAHGSLLISGSGIQFPRDIDPLLRLTDMARTAQSNTIGVLSNLRGYTLRTNRFGDKHVGGIRVTYWSGDVEMAGATGNVAEGYFVDGDNSLWKLQWWGVSNRWNFTNVALSIKDLKGKKGP
jgi:hypothetical protein